MLLTADPGESVEGPILFQARIDKSYELRVFATTESIFAFKVDSQAKELTSLDWRRGAQLLDFERTSIPSDLSQSIKDYLVRSNLMYGSFDFIVDRDGQHLFVECNSDGQWAWLETDEEPILSNALADTILKGLRK